MDINDFRRILTTFADEPSDVDIRAGKVVAQVRDEVIEAGITYSSGEEQQLRIVENEQEYAARTWLINRVARLPQLADRIINSASPTAKTSTKAAFIVPSGFISPDLSSANETDDPVPDVLQCMLAKASHPIPGATSVLYVTSDAGEGKTTVISRAAYLQAERYKQKQTHSLIVPIPLSGRAFLTFDDAVIAALVNKLRFNYLYFDGFIELVRLGAIVPAFDGYEEMLVEGSRGEAVSALGNLVQRLDSSGTVFVAARKAFFEYLSFRTQARLFDAIGDRSAAFSRLALSRWSKEQFCEYGRLRSSGPPEEVYEIVAARLGDGHPVLTRAVLVRRLFDVLEGVARTELADLLGANPHDYFFTFVDAIVKREASEKWISKVSGDVMEPLLEIGEHHQILSQIALEMWQSSTTSLRYDVLDVIVDLFCESQGKNAVATRQIKERIKQHSLLSTDTARGQGVGFDHEDFQNFYLGEGLGVLLSRGSRAELQAFLSVSIVPLATIEQAVQYLIRSNLDSQNALNAVVAIDRFETGYSFCKENCGSLAIRLAECSQDASSPLVLSGMFFPSSALAGRTLRRAEFKECHFQPTQISNSSLDEVTFTACEFERLEIDSRDASLGCRFLECKVDSIVIQPEEEYVYDPNLIEQYLEQFGARIGGSAGSITPISEADDRTKIVERVLRSFLRHSHIDDEGIRIRLGKAFTSKFYDQVLPDLIGNGILEEVPWRGQGVQKRYKLVRPMSEVGAALEKSSGKFDTFIAALK